MAEAGLSVVGQRLRRPDAGPRLTGSERYTADLTLPGMLHAGLVLSSQAHAAIRGIDASSALSEPGVVTVVTAADLPAFTRDDEAPSRARFFLADQVVSYVGQPVAVVLAETPHAAEVATDLVRVDYEPLPVVPGLETALAPDAPAVRSQVSSSEEAAAHGADATTSGPADERRNVNGAIEYRRGDPERAFREAAVTIERTFHSHAVYQSYLEPRTVVASAEPTGGVTVYASTQGQMLVRSAVASALRMPETDVRVQPMTVGGGFGAKMALLEPLVAWLAIRFRRPVKLTLTRRQDIVGTTPAPESVLKVSLAAGADGKLTALRADLTFDTGFFSNSPYLLVALMIGSYYRLPNFAIRSTEVLSHRAGAGAYRAPGLPPMMFALETLIDELARRLGSSPIEFRLANVVHEGDPMSDGGAWPALDLPALLREVETSPLLTEPRGEGEGVGIAIGGLRGGIESASATARLNADGSLSVSVGSVDLTGTTTGLTQIAAEAFGVPPERVRVTTAPSDSAPQFGITGGSKVLYSVGNAVLAAASDARRQALAVAADLLEAESADLEIVDERVQVRGAPGGAVTLSNIFARTQAPGGPFPPVFGHGNVANPVKAPAMAVHVARVKVDPDTGQVRLTGYVAAHDVGRAINPAEVEAQVHGGVAQGIGWGLTEALRYDEHGQLLSGTFMDYALPKAADVPDIEVRIIENPSPNGPYGAKGLGEAPVVPPAAAIANAIADATGARLTELPMTAPRVWEALRAAERETVSDRI